MRRVALKGLWLRRGRALLTTLAVVLGVAMVCGTYILTDTIDKAFDSIFTTGNAGTSAVVTGQGRGRGLDERARPPSPARCSTKVRDVDGVGGRHRDRRGQRLRHRPGPADRPTARRSATENAPKLGFGADFVRHALQPVHARRRALPDAATARSPSTRAPPTRRSSRSGDQIGVAAQGAEEPFTVTGVVTYGEVNSLGGATIGAVRPPDRPAAARQGGPAGHDRRRRRRPASRTRSSRSRPQGRRSATRAKVQTAAEQQASEDSEDIKEATSFIRYFLLAFGFIALGVGAFVIYNTLTITVAQRIRELATLRALGASRQAGAPLRADRGPRARRARVGRRAGARLLPGQGAVGAVRRARHRPAQDGRGAQAAHDHRVAAGRHRRHGGRAHRAGPARDAHPARRRDAGGREAAAPSSARGGRSSGDRRRAGRGRAARHRRVRRPRRSGSALVLLGVGTLVAVRRRRRCSRTASSRRWRAFLGAPARRAGGAAGHLAQRERDAQPGAHGVDRRRADDRARAGDARGDARRRACARRTARRSRTRSPRRSSSPPRTASTRSRPRPATRAAEVPGAEVYAVRHDCANAFGDDVSVNGVPDGIDAVVNAGRRLPEAGRGGRREGVRAEARPDGRRRR